MYTYIATNRAWLESKGEHTLVELYGAVFGLNSGDMLSTNDFYQYITYYRQNLEDTDKYFLTICLLLLTSELHLSICPPYAQESSFRYTPVRRCAFRSVIGLFFEYIDAAFLCNCAERQVADFIAERSLQAHLPDPITQEVASLGPAEHHLQSTAPVEILKFIGFFGKILSLVTSNPCITHTALKYEYKSLCKLSALSATVVISGWSSENDDLNEEWKGLKPSGAAYGLVWEAGTLFSSAVKAIEAGVTAAVPGLAVKAGVVAVVSAGLAGAGSCLYDFVTGCQKAAFTGKELARHLQEHVFGFVPISLIGFSMGCRVIYYCLKELSKALPQCYIQDVILLGGAVKNDPMLWDRLLKCVAGRAVNVYSNQDGMLKKLYIIPMILKPPPIGIGPVLCMRMENFDASEYITGHQDHRKHLTETLARIGYIS